MDDAKRNREGNAEAAGNAEAEGRPPAPVWAGARSWLRDRELFLVAAAITLVGIVFRVQGQTTSFWLDEADWANRILNGEAWLTPMRPTGFVGLTMLAGKIHASEWMLRLPSLLASVGMLVAAGVLTNQVTRSRLTTYVAMTLIALQPVLITQAKEAKPYMLEAALHLLLIVAVLAYRERQTRQRLAALMAAILILPWFATTLVFLLPPAVLAALLVAWDARRKRHLLAILGISVVSAAALAILYLSYVSEAGVLQGAEEYWGNKYGVFYGATDVGHASESAWILHQYEGIAAWAWAAPGFRLGGTLPLIALLVNVLGLVVLGCRRQWAALLCLALPLPIMGFFNAIGLWPAGAFRTNVFAIAYCILPALVAFDAFFSLIAGQIRVFGRHARLSAWLAGALVLCGVAAWRAPPTAGYYEHKSLRGTAYVGTRDGNVREALEHIDANSPSRSAEKPITVVCDPTFLGALKYYLRHHPGVRALGERFRRDFVWKCSAWKNPAVMPALQRALAAQDSTWVAISASPRGSRRVWAPIEAAVRRGGLRLEFDRRLPAGGRVALIHIAGR